MRRDLERCRSGHRADHSAAATVAQRTRRLPPEKHTPTFQGIVDAVLHETKGTCVINVTTTVATESAASSIELSDELMLTAYVRDLLYTRNAASIVASESLCGERARHLHNGQRNRLHESCHHKPSNYWRHEEKIVEHQHSWDADGGSCHRELEQLLNSFHKLSNSTTRKRRFS